MPSMLITNQHETMTLNVYNLNDNTQSIGHIWECKKKGNDAQGCRLINQNYIINKILEVIGAKMFSRFYLCNDNLSFHIIHCC